MQAPQLKLSSATLVQRIAPKKLHICCPVGHGAHDETPPVVTQSVEPQARLQPPQARFSVKSEQYVASGVVELQALGFAGSVQVHAPAVHVAPEAVSQL